MRKKMMALLFTILVLSLILSACSGNNDADPTQPVPEASKPTSPPATLPDASKPTESDNTKPTDPPATEPDATVPTEPPKDTTPPATKPPTATTPPTTVPTTPPTNPPAPSGGLSGAPVDILKDLLDKSDEKFGMTSEKEIDSGSSQGYLGLSPDNWNKYVESAAVSEALISANAHLLGLVKCKDDASAAEVAKLIASNFDSARLICVMPEQSSVAQAGSYVFLVSTTNDGLTSLSAAFNDMAGGTAGSFNTFFTR